MMDISSLDVKQLLPLAKNREDEDSSVSEDIQIEPHVSDSFLIVDDSSKLLSRSADKSKMTGAVYLKYTALVTVGLLFVVGATVPAVSMELTKLSQEATMAIRNRFPRSPFFPPTVTSFRPPIRRSSNGSRPIPKLNVPVRVQNIGTIHPSVVEQRGPLLRKSPLPPVASSKPEVDHVPSRVSSAAQPHPFITSQVYLPKSTGDLVDGDTSIHLISAKPQNDQDLQVEEKVENEEDFGHHNYDSASRSDAKARVQTSRIYRDHPYYYPPSLSGQSNEATFLSYKEVLKNLNKTDGEMRILLKRKGIDFSAFAGLIEGGATKKEVLNLLKVSYLPEASDEAEKEEDLNIKHYEKKKGGWKKMLTDIPFTEIVHEIPVSKSYDEVSIDDGFEEKDDFLKVDKKKAFNKHKKHKKKKKHDKHKSIKVASEKDEYSMSHLDTLMISPSISTPLPPKDSPMAVNYMPPKKKEKNASILSFSVEQPKIAKSSNSYETLVKLNHIRQAEKLTPSEPESVLRKLNDDPTTTRGKHTSTYTYADRKKYEEEDLKKVYEHSKLRLIFPMKGILIFCASLGGLAFLTTLILIVYATVRCRQKPAINNYRVNEVKGGSETTILSASL